MHRQEQDAQQAGDPRFRILDRLFDTEAALSGKGKSSASRNGKRKRDAPGAKGTTTAKKSKAASRLPEKGTHYSTQGGETFVRTSMVWKREA